MRGVLSRPTTPELTVSVSGGDGKGGGEGGGSGAPVGDLLQEALALVDRLPIADAR